MIKLLIVDDSKTILRGLTSLLEAEGYVVTPCESVTECKRLIKKTKYDFVLYNSSMRELNGHDFISYVHSKALDINCLMIVEKDISYDDAFYYAKNEVLALIEKPIIISKLLNTLRSLIKDKDNEDRPLSSNPRKRKTTYNQNPTILGSNPVIIKIKNLISKVADTDVRVLITGANGTGKELVARSIYFNSSRKDAPMIEVNCAAIPEELIESTLFGHEKGAFTSAASRSIGKFEQANNGTLFLDEIGDMSLSAQAKVLRALQENSICRVGGNETIKVNVRIISATNKNLKEEIAKGNFREDLFHRLNVIPINVPALCDRRDDIPLMLDYFNQLFSEKLGRKPFIFTPDAINKLMNKPWSGNIRELQNVVERLTILCEGRVTLDDVNRYCNE